MKIKKKRISEKNSIKERARIKERVMKLLKFRLRSTYEIKERLKRLEFNESLIEEVVNEFAEEGILDDQKFVRAFVSDYTELKPKGNYFILRELKKKGIPQEEIETALKSRDEKEIALNLIGKKMKGLDKRNPKDRSKIMRRLLSRGFTPEVVFEIIGEEK